MVFTLYSGPNSWKTNIPLAVNERSLINNVTPTTEFSGTSPLMAPVDRQASATQAVQQRICQPAWESLSLRCFFSIVYACLCNCVSFFFLPLTVSCQSASGRKISEKTTAAIPTTPPLARGASPQIPSRTSDTKSAAYRSVRKVIEPPHKTHPVTIITYVYAKRMPVLRCKLLQEDRFDSLKWAAADEAIERCLGSIAVTERTHFSYICVRPSAAVSRCAVQFMLSALIPSAPGFLNGLNLKGLVLECERILSPCQLL